jgi:vesicle-associated membrane protein 7
MAVILSHRRVAFSFLEDIKIKFNSTYGETGKTALAYAMNEEFSRVLCKQVQSVRPIIGGGGGVH